VPEEFVLAAAS